MKCSLERRSWTLLDGHRGAGGPRGTRETIVISLSDGAITGFGEAAPLDGYTAAGSEECFTALAALAPRFEGLDPDAPDLAIGALGGQLPAPARAGLDTALRDLCARRAGIPLCEMLGDRAPAAIRSSRLLPPANPDDTAHAASAAIDDGFESVKLKIGPGADESIALVASVADRIGADPFVVGDANGSLAEDGLAETVQRLSRSGLDLLEQPCRGFAWAASLSPGPEPLIALDEAGSLELISDPPPAISAVCLKLQRSGGIDRLITDARSARAAGLHVYLGSTLEGPIGIAAALHAATAIAPDLPSGLATLDSFAETSRLAWTTSGSTTAPDGAGLAIDPSGEQS